jgi:hypothetical protein
MPPGSHRRVPMQSTTPVHPCTPMHPTPPVSRPPTVVPGLATPTRLTGQEATEHAHTRGARTPPEASSPRKATDCPVVSLPAPGVADGPGRPVGPL